MDDPETALSGPRPSALEPRLQDHDIWGGIRKEGASYVLEVLQRLPCDSALVGVEHIGRLTVVVEHDGYDQAEHDRRHKYLERDEVDRRIHPTASRAIVCSKHDTAGV